MKNNPIAAGKNSFDLVDVAKVDTCLLVTVLHDLISVQKAEGTLIPT